MAHGSSTSKGRSKRSPHVRRHDRATFDRLVLRSEAVERPGLAVPRRGRERHPDGPLEREPGRRRPVPRPDRVGRQRDPVAARGPSGRPARLVVGVTVPRQGGQAPVGAGEWARQQRRGRSARTASTPPSGIPRRTIESRFAATVPLQLPQRCLLLGAATASQTSSGRRILTAVGGLTVGHRHDTDRPAVVPAARRAAHPRRASRRPDAARRPRRARHCPRGDHSGSRANAGSQQAPRACPARRRTLVGWDGDRTRPPAPRSSTAPPRRQRAPSPRVVMTCLLESRCSPRCDLDEDPAAAR